MKKSLEDIVKLSVREAVRDSVGHPVMTNSYYSVPKSVWNSVWNSVCDPVSGTVKFSVKNFVIFKLV